MTPPFKETLAELRDSEKPLASARLVELSHLTPEEASLLDKTWPEIESRRRRQLMDWLVELAEANPKLDFDIILRNRLHDPDEAVRSKAVEGLWESEDSNLINPFIEMMQKDSSPAVQAAAAQNLGRFALMAEFDRLRPDYKARLGETLAAIFNDETRQLDVRRRALESLAPLSLPQTRPAISRAYHSGEPGLKTSAIYAMGKTCDPGWLDILLKESENRDAETRYEVCQACGEIGGAEAVSYLARHIKDPDADVRLAAITALGKIGGAEAKEYLKKCLKSDRDAVKDAARAALDEFESDENPFSLRF
ncbi:MAG: HEAT repeat domain-containing protein [Chloroflexota bacterium]